MFRMAASRVGSFCARALSLVLAALFISSTYTVHAGNDGGVLALQPPSPPGPLNATEQTDGILGTVRGDLLAKHIQALQDFGTRYSPRGDRCYAASEYIASVFEANGLAVEYDYFPYSIYTLRNVIGVKEGKTMPGSTVIICAHYDSHTMQAWSDAPGADDNGSGTAAVLAIAETLSDYDFNCTIKFIAFSGEEQGLLGSEHYAAEANAAGENIIAVLNMDMIAHNPEPSAPFVYLEIGDAGGANASELVAEVYETMALHPGIGLQILDGGSSSNTDHFPFSYNYPAIAFFEYQFSLYYHQVTDTIDKLNMTYCANVTQITLATAARIAGIMPGDIAPPALSQGSPRDGGYGTGTPTISIEATDPGSFNMSSIELLVNGNSVTPYLSPVSQGYNISYAPPLPFADGLPVDVSFTARDASGNMAYRSWSFTVDSTPPQPPTNFTLAQTRAELVKRGVSLDVGTTYDAAHVLAPSVLFMNGEYKMWYTASSSTAYQICYASSTTGTTPDSWTKHGIVLSRGAVGSPDSYNMGYPTVIYDGEYRMWYAGFDNVQWRILYANSSDGINWVKRGIALDAGPAGAMDSKWATYPCVLLTDEYEMWYMGFDGVEYRYLYANSTDGLVWNRQPFEVGPEGSGKRYGDGLLSDMVVTRFNGTYYMYYGSDDGTNTRTILARSPDGLDWSDVGLATDGVETLYDFPNADHCTVLMTESETRVYYSAYSGNWRIMLGNITPADRATDLALTWTPSASADVVGYELFRETRLERLSRPLERASLPRYWTPEGLTPWAFEAVSAANATVQGPTTGSDPTFFYLPEGGLLDLTLCLEYGTGEWSELVSENDYYADMGLGFVQLFTGELPAGTRVRAWYNCTAGRALWTDESADCLADVRAGAASWMSYYYVIRAVDRAGNLGQSPVIVGKIGTDLGTSWNLVCNPFLDSPKPVADALESMDWSVARTWEPALFPNQWTIAHPEPMPLPDTLAEIDVDDGVWAKVDTAGIFAVCGPVSDVTIELRAGWNLVAYPYHDIKTVADALAGVPWDRVEVFCPSEPGFMLEAVPSDQLYPGSGLWVHATSDFPWYADNAP